LIKFLKNIYIWWVKEHLEWWRARKWWTAFYCAATRVGCCEGCHVIELFYALCVYRPSVIRAATIKFLRMECKKIQVAALESGGKHMSACIVILWRGMCLKTLHMRSRLRSSFMVEVVSYIGDHSISNRPVVICSSMLPMLTLCRSRLMRARDPK